MSRIAHSTPSEDLAVLTEERLDERQAINHVSDDSAGATVLFTGTTRNSFQGKEVIRLEYEAYARLAMSLLSEIMQKARTSAPFANTNMVPSANADPNEDGRSVEDRITRCFVAHRLGVVPVGESSIMIAVSSPHRKEAFVVAEWILEEVKKNVPVWKREFYASGQTIEALDGQAPSSSAPADRAAQGWSWKANFPP